MIMRNTSYHFSPPTPSESDLASIHTTPETQKSHILMADQNMEAPLSVSSKPPSALRRARSPPRNEQGAIYCDHPSCRGRNQLFRRVCEWNKHMDRHERPYKCREAGCELNPGFTYSGGLLRHQREVHKMHLSTRQPLFCPFPNCNRSSGAGFTRKENLEEHKRRRHLEEMSDPASERGTSRQPASVTTTSTSQEPAAKRRKVSAAEAAQQGASDVATGFANIASVESQVIESLRAELRHKDDILIRQQAELQHLQNMLRTLPPQIYGVIQSRIPGGGVG